MCIYFQGSQKSCRVIPNLSEGSWMISADYQRSHFDGVARNQ